jgi:hypothetical protein
MTRQLVVIENPLDHLWKEGKIDWDEWHCRNWQYKKRNMM